jgi:hypothetical protein
MPVQGEANHTISSDWREYLALSGIAKTIEVIHDIAVGKRPGTSARLTDLENASRKLLLPMENQE